MKRQKHMNHINYVRFTCMLLTAVLFTVTGCYKDYVKFTPYSSYFKSKEAFYDSAAKKDVIVKSNADKSFIIEHGDLLIQFKDSSFVKKSNQSIVASDIEVAITTFSNAGKMVLNNRPSTSYEASIKENIIAHQYIYIEITSNKEEVLFANGKKALVHFQSESELANLHELYTFKPFQLTEINPVENSWEIQNLGDNNLMYTFWSLEDNENDYMGKGYIFEIDDGWTCFGSYMKELHADTSDYKNIYVDLQEHYYLDGKKYNLPEIINVENTDVYVLQGELPIASKVVLQNGQRIAHGIFNNATSKIVVISEMNNKLFYNEKNVSNLKNNEHVRLTPLPHEPSDIISKLLKN